MKKRFSVDHKENKTDATLAKRWTKIDSRLRRLLECNYLNKNWDGTVCMSKTDRRLLLPEINRLHQIGDRDSRLEERENLKYLTLVTGKVGVNKEIPMVTLLGVLCNW